jgi:hypothetical protein
MLLIVGVVHVAVLWLLVPHAQAIPAFSRRYDVSCQACHSAWPELNATGRAFMLSGYRRMLGREVEPKVKDIEIGRALTLPAVPPLSIALEAGFDSQQVRRRAADGSAATRRASSFDVNELGVMAGTPLGKNLSFFLDYPLFETEIERRAGPGEANETASQRDFQFETEGPGAPEMAFLRWNSLLPSSVAPADILNLMVGVNELPLGFSPMSRRVSASPYLIYERRALDLLSGMPLEDLLSAGERARVFRLGETQTGLQVNGRPAFGPLVIEYYAGVAAGSNREADPNTEKDLYARLALRWEGGDTPGVGQMLGVLVYWSPDTYDDNLRARRSLSADGIFSGRARRNELTSVGPDLTLTLEPWELPLWLNTQVLFNRESDPTGFGRSFTWWGGFSQLNWRVLRPLIAYARFDWLRGDRFDDTGAGGMTGPVRPREWAATGGLQWFVLDNLKVLAEYSRHEFENRASTPARQEIQEDVIAVRFSFVF